MAIGVILVFFYSINESECIGYIHEIVCFMYDWISQNLELPIVVLGNPQETPRKPPGNPHHFLVSKCTTRKPPGFFINDNQKLPIVVLGNPQETPIVF